MRIRARRSMPTLAAIGIMVIVACSPALSVADQSLPNDVPSVRLYRPSDRTAMAFALPDLVGGLRLAASADAVRAADEVAFAHDLVVKPKLVSRGLGPSAVSVEQKSSAPAHPSDSEIPAIAISAVWVDGIPATEFAEFDPSFYLLLTSVTPDQYRWAGEKPGRERATVIDREIWSSDWGRFQVVWYPMGEVLYIVLAENQQLLESTLRQMPWPAEVSA